MPATRTSLSVFITGASSGIGRALACHYARQGASVLGLVARRVDVLQALADNLRASDPDTRIFCYPLDVTDERALHDAAQDFLAQAGVPDIVIASAGVSSGTLTENAGDLATIRRIFAINVHGLIATFSPFIADMQRAAQGGKKTGRLVGIASVAGIRGLPGAGAYSGSKSAVITYLESLRLEMRASGLKVVTIAPGYIATPMTAINTYSMPFLMPAEQAAPLFAQAIEHGASYVVIPWPMGLVAKLLRLLPNWLFDRLFAKAPRKSRVL